MRILNILNGSEGDKPGLEQGFRALKESGCIDDVYNVYYRELIATHGLEHALRGIIEMAARHEVDVAIMYHVAGHPIPREFYRELKAVKSMAVLVYDEHDGYERFRKPFQKPVVTAMSEADIISLCGLGAMAKLVRRPDRHKIVYTPDWARLPFDRTWVPTLSREYDVIMIGNRLTNRLPLKRMSGAATRERVVRALGDSFGQRFAVYGRGWEGFIGNKGVLPFHKQIEAIRESWISIGVDHCTRAAYYCSSRLPTSMSAGVAHVCQYRTGYDVLFEQGKDIVWFERPGEAVDIVRAMLSRGPEYLVKMGENARTKALECLTPAVVLGNLMETVKRLKGCRKH